MQNRSDRKRRHGHPQCENNISAPAKYIEAYIIKCVLPTEKLDMHEVVQKFVIVCVGHNDNESDHRNVEQNTVTSTV